MQARSSWEMYRRLFREITKEQLPWMSRRTETPKCRFSSGSLEKRDLLFGSRENSPKCRFSSGSLENRDLLSGSRENSKRSSILWIRGGLSTRGEDLVMVRSVECLGGLRGMGITHRPAERAATHGTRTVLPTTDEERHTDEFLRQERKKQAAKVMKTEQQVGAMAGVSLSATDTEYYEKPGSNSANIQKDIAGEMTRKSELGADNGDGQSASGHHLDPNADNPSVDEEVKRGLVADSAFPIGRKEKVNESEKHGEHVPEGFKGETKVDVSEHGSFKTL